MADATIRRLRGAAALLALAYVLAKVLAAYGEGGLDFRSNWLAGQFWNEGRNPYGADFQPTHDATFGVAASTNFWPYPPYWLPLSSALARLPFPVARLAWVAASAAMLAAACWLAAGTLARVSGADRRALALEAFAFGGLLQATAVTFSIGQTSFLPLLGAALALSGVVEGRTGRLIAGGVLLALKPNVGFVVMGGVLGLAPRRAPVVASAALASLGALPLLLRGQLVEQTQGFLATLERYDAAKFAANQPANSTGLAHLLDWAGLPLPGNVAFVLLAGMAALALGAWARASGDARRQVLAFGAVLTLAFFAVTLHSYDIVAIVLAGAIARALRPAAWPVAALALAACFRPGNLVALTGLRRPESPVFPESALVSLALLALLVAFALALAAEAARARRRGSGAAR